MRKTAISSILIALTTLLWITGTTVAQEIGDVYDPEPNIEGYFEYTVDDWKFIGSVENERIHVLSAVYDGKAPDDLGIHLETEFGLNTQSN
jgi:hypothetical protein